MDLLCRSIAEWCRKNGDVSEADYPIVLYGIQTLFNTSLKVMGILMAGLALHRFWAVLVCTTVFCSMRHWTGGWHSKSHLGCFCTMFIVCVGSTFFIGLEEKWVSGVLSCMMLYSVYKILKYAPCNSKVNPISDAGIMRIRRTGSVAEALVLSVITVLLRNTEFRLLIIMPLFIDALLLKA